MISRTHGMMPDGNVSDALVRILRLRDQDWMAVIRSIDSTHAQDGLTKALAFHRVAYDVVNGNVCVSIDTLQKTVDAGFFSGFDEVWIISGNPPAFDLASLPSATSDGADFSSGIPDELPIAMEKTNCVVILGDGCGLNYATTDAQLREEITKGEPPA